MRVLDGIEKRIHGHAKLELFDAKTKELVQKVEKDNLVTSALTRLVNNVVGGMPAGSNYLDELVMPIATRALGGVMLFDGALEESTANYTFPMDVSLVGFGTREVNTVNTKAGSLNEAESGPINGGYRSVWDFGTSQANGNIYSVALTNQRSNPFWGYSDPEIHTVINSSGQESDWAIPVHYVGEYLYLINGSGTYTQEWDSTTRVYTYYNTLTINVYKERIPLTNYKVADAVNQRDYPSDLITSETFQYTTVGNALPYIGNPYVVVSNGYDGYLYFVYVLGNSEGDGTVVYFTMDIRDQEPTFEASDITTLSLTNAALKRVYGNVSGGYMYLVSNDLHSLYKVQIANTANVSQIVLPEDHYFLHDGEWAVLPHPSGGVSIAVRKPAANGSAGYYDFYAGYINKSDAITLDGTYNRRESYLGYGISRKRLFLYDYMLAYDGINAYYTRYYRPGHPITNYLGTIANLSSPIAKNASQTLKVTYELYDA